MGDIDGDGNADWLIGAPGDDDSSNNLKDAGSVTAYNGATGAFLAQYYGVTAKTGLGDSVAIGDVDGDGKGDLMAGAAKGDSPTTPKVTKDTGSVSVWSGDNFALITTLYGEVKSDGFGMAVSAGDVNSDGHADLIIGIPGFDIPPDLPTKIIKDAGAVKVQSGATLSL